MAATRVYGIPRLIESREIFFFNKGLGKLTVTFTGGVPDPKFNIPATYSTSNPVEQAIIEQSSQFGKRVFRYGPNGNVITKSTFDFSLDPEGEVSKGVNLKKIKKIEERTKIYENVETIGEATEVLLDLGCPADELGGTEAIIAAMVKMKVTFPNLKLI